MDLLKRLFGGGGSRPSSDAAGMYYYVRPRGCEEVVRVRIDRNNDLSMSDDGGSYWVHKVVRGVKCRENVELDLFFDANRRLTDTQVKNGELVNEDAYRAWSAAQTPQS
jgi:hypothetical protein